jgi:hypothetical protein
MQPSRWAQRQFAQRAQKKCPICQFAHGLSGRRVVACFLLAYWLSMCLSAAVLVEKIVGRSAAPKIKVIRRHRPGGQEAVGWDGRLGANPAWPPSSFVLTVCGCHAVGNEVASVARFGRLDSSSGIYSCACSLVRTEDSELSWWGLKKLFAFTCRTHASWQSLQLYFFYPSS